MERTRIQLADGVYLTYLPARKFKTSLLSAQFVTPLQQETASAYALLPAILTIIANIILRFYPIDNTMRAQMQKDLAEKIGISKPHMSNIETAHTKIGLETLVAIANALNTSVDEFLSDTVSNSQVIFNDELKTVLERADMEELKVICKLARVILKKD